MKKTFPLRHKYCVGYKTPR